jgi:large subunit ribosomal protein L6
MVTGVSAGYSKKLLVNGVGFRAEIKGKILALNLGYSTQIEFMIPDDVQIVCENPSTIVVSGIDKQRVGQVSSEIRSLRTPEPYKGKGIRYDNEVIRRKVGKSGGKK